MSFFIVEQDLIDVDMKAKLTAETILHTKSSGTSYGTPHLNGRSVYNKICGVPNSIINYYSELKLGEWEI